MLNLAFDFQAFSMQQYGGISRYFCELIVALTEQYELDLDVVAPFFINRYLSDLKQNQQVKVTGSAIPHIHKSKFYQTLGAVNYAVSKAKLGFKRPDIVHETYYYPKRVAPESAKTVVTVHDMIHEKFSQLFQDNNPLSREKKLAIDRASKVICVSKNTRQDLIELLGVDPNKISVVYHGCSLKNVHPQPIPGAIQSPYILYVGSRGEYKNFQRLLEAYAASAALRSDFSLICFGGGSFSKIELQQLNQLGITEGKILQVSGGDRVLTSLYKQAAAFVYPSLYEGFGIPLLEAMTLHCPVVCSNTSCMPEVVETAAELFDPYSVDSIVLALEKVLFSASRTQELIEQGLERVTAFSWSKCAEQTYEVYASLV